MLLESDVRLRLDDPIQRLERLGHQVENRLDLVGLDLHDEVELTGDDVGGLNVIDILERRENLG